LTTWTLLCASKTSSPKPAKDTNPVKKRSASRHLYVGTAAWNNPPTERATRLSGQSHLHHYTSHFRAVEINSSFYRQHQRKTYERWREDTPQEFRFSVKLPRSITHEGALRHYRRELDQFLQEVAGLKQKLRVILVQTPASLAFEPRAATRFFASLTAATRCRVALEPRSPSWFIPQAEALLDRHGVARVASDPARPPEASEPRGARGLIYYRLHGSPRMYYSAYSADYLRELHAKIASLPAGAKEVWCIFDNTARHASWDNALTLRKLEMEHRPHNEL
jgi:uncharacterized protein YecE (DUF72 family)